MRFPGSDVPSFWREEPPPEPPPATVALLRARVVHEQCTLELLRAADRLMSDDDEACRSVGAKLDAWLRTGGNLAKRLGVAGRRGSHRCAQAVVRELEKPHRDDSTR